MPKHEKIDPTNTSERRLGRSITRIHQGASAIPAEFKAHLEELVLTGSAMDFVSRIHGSWGALPAAAVLEFASQAGVGRRTLMATVLPALKRANVADYVVKNDELQSVEEYLGVTGTLVEQSYRVLEALRPSRRQLAVLHSVEIGTYAPLTEQQHLEQLTRRAFSAEEADAGYKLAIAAHLNHRVRSSELNEWVVFNPYVWESSQLPVATFLRSLPSGERDALLGICEQASSKPGLALPGLRETTPGIFAAAQKVGLVQAATVKSSGSHGSQTYVFSPALDNDDDRLVTTESLHQRKMFVAHMLFGHERAEERGGRIQDPVVLVNALLNRGSVGPATNIGTDYHLLEAHGIVAVRESGNGRAYLELVKKEIVEGGLTWLRRSSGSSSSAEPQAKLVNAPGEFASPEKLRAQNQVAGVGDEIARSAVLELRKQVQSATRQDRPANFR